MSSYYWVVLCVHQKPQLMYPFVPYSLMDQISQINVIHSTLSLPRPFLKENHHESCIDIKSTTKKVETYKETAPQTNNGGNFQAGGKNDLYY